MSRYTSIKPMRQVSLTNMGNVQHQFNVNHSLSPSEPRAKTTAQARAHYLEHLKILGSKWVLSSDVEQRHAAFFSTENCKDMQNWYSFLTDPLPGEVDENGTLL